MEELILDYITKKYNIEKQELLDLVNKKTEPGIPIEILRDKKLSNLEAITKYLRENKNLKYSEISNILHRKTSTLAVTYKNSKAKKQGKITVTDPETIPYSAFKPGQSILGSICKHLKETGLKNIEIAKKLGKNPRTIWTTLHRNQ